jgi:SAM-dependent methyltransferase
MITLPTPPRRANSRIKATIKRILPYRVYSPLRDFFRYLRFFGSRYKCPFCRGQFSRFLPTGIDVQVLRELNVIGGGYRTNSVCPRCYSLDRERLIVLFLEKRKSHVFSEPVSVLHIAPEKNLSARLRRSPNINYLSTDLNSPTADVRMDITDIKEKNDMFDVIICNHVLEHIADDKRAMHELFRVLRPGGFAILQVPISSQETLEDPSVSDPAERERCFGQRDHVRIYGQDYPSRLESVGFSVAAPAPQDFLDLETVAEYGLLRNERVFVCSKEINTKCSP